MYLCMYVCMQQRQCPAFIFPVCNIVCMYVFLYNCSSAFTTGSTTKCRALPLLHTGTAAAAYIHTK